MKTKNYFTILPLLAVLSVGCIEGNGKGGNSYLGNPNGAGPAPVSLSTTGSVFPAALDMASSGNYVILSKAGISDTSGSVVTGNMGASPVTATAITNFALNVDASGDFSTAPNVNGNIYAADYVGGADTPGKLTTAIANMETAYTDAAGRTNPDYTEYGAGNIGGATLYPGLYKWGTGVLIPTTVYLSGSSTDVWIFQIAQDLVMSSNISVIMLGGAKPENVYWQVAGAVTIGTDSHFEGVILCATAVDIQTRASVDGRIYAQTAVTLDDSVIAQP